MVTTKEFLINVNKYSIFDWSIIYETSRRLAKKKKDFSLKKSLFRFLWDWMIFVETLLLQKHLQFYLLI